MKKLSVILLMMLLFIAACAEKEDNPEEEQNNENEAAGAEEKADESNNGVKEDLQENTEGEIENENEEEQETREAQYIIGEDATVLPIEEGINENVVLITIDDAPGDHALEMAETLSKLDAGAIFFVNGHFLDSPEEEEALKQLHEMGFLIGNHTYNHPLLTDIPEEEQHEEIVSLSDRVEEIIGERPKFFRAPNGMNTDFSEALAEEEGMVLMNWTYGYDYFEPYMDAQKLAEAMITGEGPEVDVPYSLLKPGANLLMHDRAWTNEALEEIVSGLRDSGYETVDPALIETIK
ncbi:polysaccharide deacetylase family protein [Oceanobacillus sp. FSL H7-0719]|uniref:polysaccharide deacetylase family protein n=1 Tax=Oceanobacillus sp. FSL H7-0719 TaxID=2954507 RepID=UPI0032454FCF